MYKKIPSLALGLLLSLGWSHVALGYEINEELQEDLLHSSGNCLAVNNYQLPREDGTGGTTDNPYLELAIPADPLSPSTSLEGQWGLMEMLDTYLADQDQAYFEFIRSYTDLDGSDCELLESTDATLVTVPRADVQSEDEVSLDIFLQERERDLRHVVCAIDEVALSSEELLYMPEMCEHPLLSFTQKRACVESCGITPPPEERSLVAAALRSDRVSCENVTREIFRQISENMRVAHTLAVSSLSDRVTLYGVHQQLVCLEDSIRRQNEILEQMLEYAQDIAEIMINAATS